MKESNEILEDSSLKLAVQLDDTRKQARDLETAFDMTTDSSLDVAKAEDKLVKSITDKTKATERATEYIDTVAYSQRNSAAIEDDYQKALQRRTELENKISKQSPIVRYSEQVASGESQPTSPDTAPEPSPAKPADDVDAALAKYLKERGMTSRKERDDKRVSDKKDKDAKMNFIVREVRDAGIAGIQYIAKGAMSTVSNAIGTMVSGVESAVFKDIPGYGMAKGAVLGAVGATGKMVKTGGSKLIEKYKESSFQRDKQKEISKFHEERGTSGQERTQDEQANTEAKEQKQERNENRQERGENDKRHKSLITVLKDLGKMILIGGIMKMFSGLLGSLSMLGTGLFSRFGLLITTLGGLAAKFAGAMKTALAGMFDKVFPDFKKKMGKTPDVDKNGKPKPKPDVDADGKTKTDAKGKPKPNVEIDADGKPKTVEPGKPNAPEMKPGKALGEAAETVEGKAGSKAAAAGTKGIMERLGGKAALKGAAKVVGSVAARFIPFVGTALLLSDLYDIADYVSGGKVTEMVEDAGTAIKEKLSPVANIQSGMAPESASVEQSGENLKRAETEKKERDRQREAAATQARMAMVSNVSNNNTSVYTSGFGFQSDHPYSNSTPHGVQNR